MWENMIEFYELQDNEWLKGLFDAYVNSKTMTQFVEQYDNELKDKVESI